MLPAIRLFYQSLRKLCERNVRLSPFYLVFGSCACRFSQSLITTYWISNHCHDLLDLQRALGAASTLFWRWSPLSYHCLAAVSPTLVFYCRLVLFISHLSFHIISHLLPTIPTCILVSLTFHLSRNCSYFFTLFFRHLFTRLSLFINSSCRLFYCPTNP